MTSLVISREEGRKALNVGMNSFDALIRRQNDPLPSIRVGRRVLIPVKEFEEWMERQTKKEPSE